MAISMAAILSGVLMVEHWGMIDEALKIKDAFNRSLNEGVATEDLT